MKGIAFVITAFVLAAGGLSVSYSQTGDTTTVSVRMDDPERAAQAAGAIISEIGDTLHTVGESAANESAAHQPAADTPAEPTLYRIRNAACDPASQIGAYYNYEAAKSVCAQGYCVFDQNGTLLYAG